MAAAAALCLGAGAAHAQTTLTASSATDLQQDINTANSNPTTAYIIQFPSSLNGHTLTLTSNQPISGHVTIQGPGAALLTISAASGEGAFQVTSGGNATFSGVTITGATGSSAISVDSLSTLSVTNCTFSGNTAPDGGAINSAGTLMVNGSTFAGNSSTDSAAGGGGALYINGGTATVDTTSFSANTANYMGGAINVSVGIVTLANSAVYSNSASSGGGIYNSGTLTITGSTVSGNTASSISGPEGGGVQNQGTLSIVGSTISGNTSNGGGGDTSGGGIWSDGTLSVANSIVAGNMLACIGGGCSTDHADIYGAYLGNGNLADNSASATSPYAATLLLSPLQLNGIGATLKTMIPLPGSPAICAGLVANIPHGVTTDGRGYPLQPKNGYCDSTHVDAGAVQTNYTSVQFVQEPTDTAVNTAIAPAPTVEILETDTLLSAPGNTDAVNGVSIPLSYSGGASELSGGAASLSATTASGVATYSITPSTTGSAFTLSAGSDGNGIEILSGKALTAISDDFDVYGAAQKLVVSAPGTAIINVPFNVSVTAVDANGNTVLNDNDTVNLTITGYSGILTTIPLSSGTGSTTVTLGLAGPVTLTGTDATTSSVTGQSGTIVVSAPTPTTTTLTNGNITLPWSATDRSVNLTISITAGGNNVDEGSLTVPLLVPEQVIIGGVVETIYKVVPYTVALTSSPYQYSMNLPAGAYVGSYPLQFSYSDPGGMYASSSDTGHTLTITAPSLVVNNAGDNGAGATDCAYNPTTTGPGVCTLRDALDAALNSGGGVVTFDSAVFASAQTITLAGGKLLLPQNTAVNGPTSGAGAALENLVTVNGNNAGSVFTMNPGMMGASLANLTITGGNASLGGGIAMSGEDGLTVSNCTISGNTSPAGAGILVQASSTLSLTGSTIANNTGDGLRIGGMANATIAESTFTNNSGGGIGVYGATLVSIESSTIAGNNTPTNGAGINWILAPSGGSVTLSNTIVAGNSAGNAGPDAYNDAGTFNDMGGNLIGVGGGGSGNTGFTAATTQTGTVANPLSAGLGALGNYGGPTQTMLPEPGSPAICKAPAANVPSGVTTDQRGVAYSAGGYCASGKVDTGAVQTDYALSFSKEPPSSGAIVGTAMSPAPQVSITENGTLFTAASVGIAVTDANSDLKTSPATANTSSGVATFGNLVFGGITTGDTLKATMLSPSLAATSTAFTVGPAMQTRLNLRRATYPGWVVVHVCVDGTAHLRDRGSVTLLDNGKEVHTEALDPNGCEDLEERDLDAGNHIFTVDYSGNGKLPAGQSAPIAVTIAKAWADFDLDCAPSIVLGKDEQCHVSLSFPPGPGGPKSAPPTGAVTLTLDGGKPISVTLDRHGNATVTLPKPALGNHTVAGAYAGSDNFNPATQTRTFTVVAGHGKHPGDRDGGRH
jgi:predicted outer membrane repeat protein